MIPELCDVAHRHASDIPHASWNRNQLQVWLAEHKVPAPASLSNEQLRDLVSQKLVAQ